MCKQLRIWLFVLLGSLLVSSSLLAEGVITMTTAKAVGERITLAIKANGSVSIAGVRESAQTDGYSKVYTLTSQTVTIRGNVTTFNCNNEYNPNRLTSLDVSGCTALTTLYCYDNQLTSLNVSGCTSLTKLDCTYNELTSLNLSGCTALTSLSCSKNQLTSLDLSGCTSLTKLDCNENQLTSLNVSKNTALTKLECYRNQLTSLNVSGCTALTWLECRNNQLTSLNVSDCTSLTRLNCSKNQLTSLDVSGCTTLTKLDCTYNPLSSINLSNCTSLEEFTWERGKLTSLDVSGCTSLTKLYCSDNRLTNLDVSGCTALTELKCNDNQLTSLDVSSCTALTKLDCYNNQLTSLNVSRRTALTTLDCYKNQLTSLDVSGCTALTELYCSDNRLTNLDVSGCTSLTELRCSSNPLTSINLSECQSLKEFSWTGGKLTSLDVSNCTALIKLKCNENQLTSLKVSGCTALTELWCYSNQLTRLDVSGCTALTELDCYGNQINGEGMTKLVNSLPDRKGMSSGTLGVVDYSTVKRDENRCSFADVATASKKNWAVEKRVRDRYWTSYPGVGEGIITMTTSRAVGEKIKLGIVANGDVVIEGVSEMPEPDQYRYGYNYTLTSQTITIRGDVTELAGAGNQLTSLDVSGCTTLTKLDCNNNQLTSLDVSNCTSLGKLDCSDNPLTGIDLSNCKSLKEFTWNKKELTSLDVSGCTSLTKLDCNENQLTSLKVSGCTALTELDCSKNQLTSLDVSGCTALTKLICYKNRLKGETMTQMVFGLSDRSEKESGSLYVVCDGSDENNLLRSDVLTASRKNWRVFKYIINTGKSVLYSGAGGDDEIVMTITKEQYLEGGIRLAILADGDVTIEGVHEKRIFTDGSKHTYTLAGTQVTIRGDISELDCSENQITNLDLSKCNSLWTLNCSGNKLTNVDVSGCSLLTYLDCSDNQINGENMTRLVTNLPSRKGLRSGNLVIISRRESEGNLCRPSDVAIAREKNWISTWKNGDLCKGIGEGVITMTTSLSVGQSFELSIVANEDVVIEGVREKSIRIDGLLFKVYTLTSQTVTVRGHVTSLDCSSKRLTSLNVSGCTALTKLDCSNNKLTSLNVSDCTALTKLDCSWNQLTSLDLSGYTALTELDCSNNKLTSLNVSDCTTLTTLDCRSNQLTSLNVSDCTALTKLDCRSNQLTSLNVSGCTALTTLDCRSNQLTSLDVSGCTALTKLDCSNNRLTSLDVSGCTALTELDCGSNRLTSLNASGCTALTKLDCSYNRLTSLDVSGCTALTELDCRFNRLTSLDVSGCPSLTRLNCSVNQINGEGMTKLVNSLPDRKGMSSGTLRVVDYSTEKRDENRCSLADVATASEKNWEVQKYDPHYYYPWTSYSGVGEGVVTMTTSKAVGEKVKLEIVANGDVLIEGVSETPYLDGISYDYTLTSQTITIRGDVTKLDCYNNQLTSLDVSGCTSLTNLNCNNNQLSSLELLQNSALTSLACSRNELKSLDLSACTRLKSLECYRNKIRGNAVAQLVESLPDRYGKEPGKFYFVYYSEDESEENFCYRPAVGRANDKNWRPQKGYNNRYEILWEDYFGVIDEGVVMMRTAQEVGCKITLTLEAKGDVAIDGVKGVPETDGKPHQYTLLSQDVTIRGYVTKLHCSGNKLTSLDLSTTVPLVELDCSNNQLTSLDVSHNAAVTSLTCYRNQIKGEAMAQLIKGLPQLPLRSTHLFGIVSNAADEGNVFFKADVERVQDKGWSPMKWNEERQQYEPYAGKETESFAVTLTKEGEGTINATGADDLTAVPYGTELTIVATPAEGYELISLTAGEEDILATKKVIVTDNVTVKATFDEATFAVSLKKEGEGTISATGAEDLNAVAYGTELTIVATPAEGYELTALTANGTDILATKKIVVKENMTIKATFVDHTGVETTVTQQIQLYPNPTTDYVIVEGVAPASEVTLHSMTGERLYAGRADSRGTLQIDLTPYADGVYLVCVAGETYRVVVRH